jgi:NAD+ diphosphatase
LGETIPFSGNTLLRVDSDTTDAEWHEARRADPRGRYLLLRDLDVPVTPEGDPRLIWLSSGELPEDSSEPVFIGFDGDEVPHFACGVSTEGDATPATHDGIAYVDARTLAAVLPIDEAATVAHARALVSWHAAHGFCAKCGASTASIQGGTRRECTVCGTRHYPRVDPSIIVLVEHEGRALLAGRVAGPNLRKSCVAGFVEPGESIEEAVIREVLEETGVHVEDVRYLASQPWPFPSTLMIGCRARATSTEIQVDGVEIAHADWYSRDQVRSALEGNSDELVVPGSVAIAHHLMRDFVARGDGVTG